MLNHYCIVCAKEVGGFESGGHQDKREGVKCPNCRSTRRSRLAWAYLKQRTDFFDGRNKSMLHIAPESALTKYFSIVPGIEYLSADLDASKAMVALDVTAIAKPDCSFDVIYCSHVLEHVSDDKKALREFYRVLKPGGWALLMVPIRAEVTFEDASIKTPEERERIYGQHDHVRNYGIDFSERVRESGFEVRTAETRDLFNAADFVRYGVKESPSMRVFHATK